MFRSGTPHLADDLHVFFRSRRPRTVFVAANRFGPGYGNDGFVSARRGLMNSLSSLSAHEAVSATAETSSTVKRWYAAMTQPRRETFAVEYHLQGHAAFCTTGRLKRAPIGKTSPSVLPVGPNVVEALSAPAGAACDMRRNEPSGLVRNERFGWPGQATLLTSSLASLFRADVLMNVRCEVGRGTTVSSSRCPRPALSV